MAQRNVWLVAFLLVAGSVRAQSPSDDMISGGKEDPDYALIAPEGWENPLIAPEGLCPAGEQHTLNRPSVRAALRKACNVDIKSLCAGLSNNQVIKCLSSNNKKLTLDCRDAIPQTCTPPAPESAKQKIAR